MTAIKTAKVGDIIWVPSFLLFPQRQGKWNRHNFSVARVTKVGKNKQGIPCIETEYLEAFRYRSGIEVTRKAFFVTACAKFDGFSPFSGNEGYPPTAEVWADSIEKGELRLVNGTLYHAYHADTMELFGITTEGTK
jgi:hypothetical protein